MWTLDVVFVNVQDEKMLHQKDCRKRRTYRFLTTEIHTDVQYDSNQDLFVEKDLDLCRNCDDCDWNREISTFFRDRIATNTSENLVKKILQRKTPNIMLMPGSSNSDTAFDFISYRERNEYDGIFRTPIRKGS